MVIFNCTEVVRFTLRYNIAALARRRFASGSGRSATIVLELRNANIPLFASRRSRRALRRKLLLLLLLPARREVRREVARPQHVAVVHNLLELLCVSGVRRLRFCEQVVNRRVLGGDELRGRARSF